MVGFIVLQIKKPDTEAVSTYANCIDILTALDARQFGDTKVKP